MNFEPLTDADLDTIAAQLGRRPRAATGIAARCPAGHPAVVVNHPIRHEAARVVPFPTLYWLTCPELGRAISRLEMDGLIQRLDQRLDDDEELATALHADHQSYVEQRWQQLTEPERQAVQEAGLEQMFHRRGIGGLGHWRSVKCLHLHYAHHLATRNCLGAILAAEFGILPCGPSDQGQDDHHNVDG